MTDEPTSTEQADDDQFDRLKAEVSDFHGYDEEALETYRSLSFYFYQRTRGGGSNCCQAMMRIESSSEGTAYAVCTNCGKPADGQTGLPLPMAARATCENFGHDAPRGLCRRCGLGVELGSEDERKQKDRREQREAWLATKQQRR